MGQQKWKPKIKVTCNHCKTKHDEDIIEFVSIEEDIQGRDVVTFVCPICNKTSKSYRLG